MGRLFFIALATQVSIAKKYTNRGQSFLDRKRHAEHHCSDQGQNVAPLLHQCCAKCCTLSG